MPQKKKVPTVDPKLEEEIEPAAKKAKTGDKGQAKATTGDSGAKGDVHIISSKACQAFAKRHTELEALIKKAKPTIKITIDVQPKLGSKPDKGSFVVEVGDKKIVELVALARPFQKVRLLITRQATRLTHTRVPHTREARCTFPCPHQPPLHLAIPAACASNDMVNWLTGR